MRQICGTSKQGEPLFASALRLTLESKQRFLQLYQGQTSQVKYTAFTVTFLIIVAMFLLNHLKIKAVISKRNPKRIVPNHFFSKPVDIPVGVLFVCLFC